jgi:hypothetical protein
MSKTTKASPDTIATMEPVVKAWVDAYLAERAGPAPGSSRMLISTETLPLSSTSTVRSVSPPVPSSGQAAEAFAFRW